MTLALWIGLALVVGFVVGWFARGEVALKREMQGAHTRLQRPSMSEAESRDDVARRVRAGYDALGEALDEGEVA